MTICSEDIRYNIDSGVDALPHFVQTIILPSEHSLDSVIAACVPLPKLEAPTWHARTIQIKYLFTYRERVRL